MNAKQYIGLALSSVAQPVKDFLFTTECFHCRTPLSDAESRICHHCWNSLTIVNENDFTMNVLRDRFREGGVIDDVVVMWYFERGKLLQTVAHSLKYEEVTALGIELGTRLAAKLRGKIIDGIIPVPLNKRKERERGYNQAEMIARGISSVLNTPVLTKTLCRIKYTATQTQLNAEQRKSNIAEAFTVIDDTQIKRGRLLLVDDIITTGSTIQEAAKTLINAGAKSVTAGSAGLAKLGEDS